MDYGTCAHSSDHENIPPVKENGRKLSIKNPSQKLVKTIKVDNCLPIEKDKKRCDYMFEIDDPITHVIYVELKGCDIEKAYLQLVSTIEIFTSEHKSTKKECHIVASRVPKAGAKVQDLKVELLKKKKAKLIVSTDQAFVTI